MRKITVSVLALLLILALAVPVFAAEASFVHDQADILTNQEETLLSAYVQEVAREYRCGIYIVILDDYTDYAWDPFEAAYTIYHSNNLGAGSSRDGVLLLLSMRQRDYAFFVYGENAEYALNDYAQIQLEEAMLDDLAVNRWYDGLEDFVGYCDYALEAAAAGEPIRESMAPYYLGVWIFAAVAGGIVCGVLYSQMKTAKVKTQAHDYMSAGGLHLTQTSDLFTHRTVRRRRIQTSSGSGGGGGHARSGGGGSGRSGKF